MCTHSSHGMKAMSIHNRIHMLLATVLGVVPTGLLAIVAAVATIAPVPLAEASNGQCVWEGGSGADASCRVEDCIGRGGLAQCSTRGVGAVQSGIADAQVGPDKWVFSQIEDYYNPIFTNPVYCAAAGGWWGPAVPGGVNDICHDLPADVLGGAGRSTNSEGRLFEIAKNFADRWVGLGSGCGGASTKISDTGWSLQTQSLGTATSYTREAVYKGVSCQTQILIWFTKSRAARCPPPSTQRNAVTGPECYTPGCEVCVDQGSGISMLTGANSKREVDYAPSADTGLELTRHYRSNGYFWPTYLGGMPAQGDMNADDFWSHTYQRRFIATPGNTHTMAVVWTPGGMPMVFNTSGSEVTNRGGTNGSGARLQAAGGGWDLTLANAAVEHYDSAGRLVTITARGRVTTLAYDGNGKLETVTGPFGHELEFGYTEIQGTQMLTSVTLPDSGVIEYEYDQWLRPVKVTYPDETTRQYEYASAVNNWQLTGIFDETTGRYSTYTYNTSGRVTSDSLAGGANASTYTYAGTLGQPTAVTDPLGATTQFGMTASNGAYRPGSRSQACLTCGLWANTTYDVNGNPATRTDYNGVQTVYTFDAARNLEISRTEATGTPRARTITTQWHATLRMPIEITEPGRRTNLTYDGAGNLLAQTVTDTTTNQTRTWTMTYTGLGQLLTIDGPRTDVSDITTFTYYGCTSGTSCGQLYTVTDAANNVTTFGSYNANGMPLSITDPNGTLITLAYDDRQRVTSRTIAGETTELEYWPTGLLKKVTNPDGSFVSYSYDAAHRLTSVTDTVGNSITYTLNGAGLRLTDEVRDLSNTLTFRRTRVYNNLGRLVEETGTAGQKTTFAHDANGNVTEIEDPNGRVTTQAYDALERLAAIVDPALQFTEFGYDGQDNLLSVTDPRSLETGYVYNGFGDQISQTSPDTGVSSSPVDAAGNVDTTTDARNETAEFTYDELNRVTDIEYGDETVVLAYDIGTSGRGHLTSVADSAGTTTWAYDSVGRVTERSQATGTVTLEVGYAYDTYGRLSSLTTPSGQALTYEYSDGKVTGLKVNGSWILSQVLYQPFGPIKGWTWGNNTTTTRIYDTDGQLTQVSSAGTSVYTFFDDGLIASRTDDFVASIPSSAGTTTFDVSSTSNRLENATGQFTRSYGYDAAGNMTSDGTRTFTYNDAGQMKTSTSAGVTTTYSYNGLGERVKKTNSASTTYFAYDEVGHLIGEYDAAGDLIQETVWLGDIPVATLKPNAGSGINVYYIHTDHLNTPRRITRPSDNAILWRWDSDPFGGTAANEDADNDTVLFVYQVRFPGQYFDTETGLHYNYFRDYDALTGRYVESDPIGLAGGSNTYAYANGNPIALIDPYGLDWMEYTGTMVYWYAGKTGDTRQILKQCAATSGDGESQNPAYQNRPEGHPKGAGPLPAGLYQINLVPDPRRLATWDDETGDLAPGSGVQQVPRSSLSRAGVSDLRTGWGKHRARLNPVDVPNLYGRGNFYLHDSHKGHTNGCVESCETLFDRLEVYRQAGNRSIDFRVRYTGTTTLGNTRW
jgi:RHS repeat-associated protein